MDPIVMSYYAIICGLLGVFAPRVGRWPARLTLGIAVGAISAGVIPTVLGILRW